ncbi:MAG: hypothetical protein GOMPHAMPRED_008051 [Gomphillus americanus]|uniref:Uncharacterized protein n=1 Tax=Gomphillus americanus TaxID=1940652 RepID=A0A8H3IHJ0_9LECA|nr:MAG: hypothetical protein GOMPHAMPRED_008051 [Gomphillus americanus]
MSDEFAPDTPDSELNSLASLPESATTDSETEDGDRRVSDAEREWKESLQQLELLLTMVVVPYMGKYFGRKCAYWIWGRVMEWKYPVEVVITNPTRFKAVGAIEAAATL